MPDERAQNVVVVEGPVHDAVVRVAFACCEDALVMMSKLNQVNTVPLTIISVHLLTSF